MPIPTQYGTVFALLANITMSCSASTPIPGDSIGTASPRIPGMDMNSSPRLRPVAFAAAKRARNDASSGTARRPVGSTGVGSNRCTGWNGLGSSDRRPIAPVPVAAVSSPSDPSPIGPLVRRSTSTGV